MSKSIPRRIRMNRAARLRSAKHWLPTYTGRDVVKGYRKWFGVNTVCAIMELRQLGSKIDEKRLLQAKLTEESTTRNRTVKRQRSAAKLAAEDGGVVEAEEKFAYIAGHTKGGVPYGVIWEELEAEDDPF